MVELGESLYVAAGKPSFGKRKLKAAYPGRGFSAIV
jgi:hypothetical protein